MQHPFLHLRDQFEILSRKTYLASHSLGAVPRGALDALSEYYDQWATLGIAAWDGPWWQAVADFERAVERILGAPEGTVVPMQNATRAMAAVASALEITRDRNRVVMTDLEFTTSYPFWRGLERYGAEVVLVESDDGITVPAERVVEAIDERTLIVPTCHVYFRSGAVQDVAAIVDAAHDAGAYALIDGYQAVGTVPFSVEATGADFYVGGSHKWLCGGPGAGYLYVKRGLAERLRPSLTGWFGLASPFAYERDLGQGEPAAGVHRFLAGTPNVPALYAARAGLDVVARLGVDAIHKVQAELTTHLVEEAEDRGMSVRTPRDAHKRSGMVCLDFDGAEAAARALVEQGIVVDFRPDCGLRASCHFYNTGEDVARLFEAIDAM